MVKNSLLQIMGFVCALILLSQTAVSQPYPEGSPGFYVNPFIGTGGHGHTFPGATLPFGMVQLSPDTRLEGWDGCSAYHGSDSVIYGFSHTHLSGTGCSDYGDILLMPFTGKPDPDSDLFSAPFSKSNEKASPGFYHVSFPDRGIDVNLTATTRCGFHEYHYLNGKEPGIFLDLKHRDKVLESGLKLVSADEVEGFRFSQAWAQKQMIFFVIRFSEPWSEAKILEDGKIVNGGKEVKGTDVRATFSFPEKSDKKIFVKVGISGVSIDGARKNLTEEISGWSFEEILQKAISQWNNELGKIQVEGGTPDQQVVFSTALYHTMIQPNTYNDVDRHYRGRDLQVHRADSFDYYTVFSLWDTYRAAHPLYTIIDQKRSGDFIRTFLQQYKEGGMLPVWELSGNETGCMIGYHAVPVIADAWLKGIRGYDGNLALEAMKHSANQDHLGLKYYKEKGYIPADKDGESVSKTLEYAFDDWSIAMMAKSLNRDEDYKNFIIRAQNYKNVYDRLTGFMRAKLNETWFSPFDPSEVNFNYTEANAWQYSFYVPQDIGGLMMLMGGRDRFREKLEQLFSADSKTTGRDQADITGLIGQYAHGNEPSHHMAYLYNYCGTPWKTQELVHKICHEFYQNTPDGLIGNEDCGQMSAWYIFSALGFYPVNPASGIYILGTPLFPEATITLENGKTFTVRAKNLNDKNFYIQSVSINGKPVVKTYIKHEEIMKGGELVFNLGPEPNKAWGTGFEAFPESYIRDYPITPVPAFHQGDHTFMDSTIIVLSNAIPGVNIHYTLNGSEPKLKSETYKRPMLLRKNMTVRAFAAGKESPPSKMIEAHFMKIPKNRKISITHPYAGQYAAGGDIALIDFKRGGENFRTGFWQGYEGVDLEAVVDLGVVQPVSRVAAGFLQDQGSWIFMPTEVVIFVSVDGTNFREISRISNTIDERKTEAITHEFTTELKGTNARFIKVIAKNRGTCPDWHPGAGGKAWIFTDEITIE